MMDEIETFEDQVANLEATLGEASGMTAAFSQEVVRMQSAMASTAVDAQALSKGLSKGLRTAFDGLVFEGFRASDALNAVARSMVNATYSAAIKPITNHVGGLLAGGIASVFGGAFANGASFSQGRVMPFADGGVVSGPTTFPMKGGMGLMGEAGPEAIMPLTRGPDGKLGVRAAGGGGGVTVVMNISTPDAASFERSQSQIAARMSRALGRGQRNG